MHPKPDHASATAVNQKATGAGVSAQAFALRLKLLEVDAWVRHAGIRVVEVHPEVSFATLAGRPLPESKRTWAGAIRRRRLLAEAGIVLDDELGPAGSAAAVDDILDAAVAAWTARRVARNGRPADARPAGRLHRRHPQRHLDLTTKPPSPPEQRAAFGPAPTPNDPGSLARPARSAA